QPRVSMPKARSYSRGAGSCPARRRSRYSSKATAWTLAGSAKKVEKRSRYSARGRGRPGSQAGSRSTRISSLRTAAWSWWPSGGRNAARSGVPSRASASSKAATNSSRDRAGESGGDGFIVGLAVEEGAQPGPDLLQDALDGALGAAGLLGNLGD